MEKDTLVRGLYDAGCDPNVAKRIGSLMEEGCYEEAVRQMKVARCALVEKMHQCQRDVDRMDLLIRNEEKRKKERKAEL